MFNRNRYMTRGITDELSDDLVMFIWARIDEPNLTPTGIWIISRSLS